MMLRNRPQCYKCDAIVSGVRRHLIDGYWWPVCVKCYYHVPRSERRPHAPYPESALKNAAGAGEKTGERNG